MLKRKLGKSGLRIAPLVFGGNVFGWTVDEANAFTLRDAFVHARGTRDDLVKSARGPFIADKLDARGLRILATRLELSRSAVERLNVASA